MKTSADFKVLIYGGRDFADFSNKREGSPEWFAAKREHDKGIEFLELLAEEWPATETDEYGNWLPDITVISGNARGADRLGEDWAVVNWLPLEIYPADWEKYSKAAGGIRNQQMIDDGKPNVAVQFPGGRGTADMRRRLDAAGVPVMEYVV